MHPPLLEPPLERVITSTTRNRMYAIAEAYPIWKYVNAVR